MSYEITGQSLRGYSTVLLIDDGFNLDILNHIVDINNDGKKDKLFLFMNGRALRAYQYYFKNLGSTTGFEFCIEIIGGKEYRVDKVEFGRTTLISLSPDIFNHPKCYKGGTCPYDNEIFIVTNENINPFIREVEKLENKIK